MSNYYKYLTFDKYRAEYFENELMRFTQPDDLNDPFECLPVKPTLKELENLVNIILSNYPKNYDSERKIRNTIDEKYLTEIYNEAFVNLNNEITIFSLSKNWNNILMWSHYANSHKGFCIGFKSEHSFFENFISKDGKTSKFKFDVIYSENRYKIPMIPEDRKLSFKPFITKSIDWKYEEEVRIISTINLAENEKSQKPYNICLYKVPHSAISEIILGANMSLENEKIITEFCNRKKIKMYKSEKSNDKFNMERK